MASYGKESGGTRTPEGRMLWKNARIPVSRQLIVCEWIKTIVLG